MGARNNSYAWWIVFAGFVLMFSVVGIIVNCASIFFKPVVTSLGFSRTEFSVYFTIASLSTMFAAPVMGKILSKYNMRLVMTICCLLAGIGYCSYSQCTSLIQFYAVSIPIGIGVAGLTVIPVPMMITSWFIEKRGLAMGIAFSGSGIGGMGYNLLGNWVILNYGWQTGYLVLGGLLILTTLPITLLIVRANPAEKGQIPYGAKTTEQAYGTENLGGLSLGQFIRTSSFWLLGLGLLLMGLVSTGIQLHIPAYLTDIGYSSTLAASIVALFMGVLVIGKLALGSVFDIFGSKVGLIYVCSIYMLAVVSFMKAEMLPFVFIFAILLGLGHAITTIPAPYITAEIVGQKDYGTIYGVINIFLTLGMSVGMLLSGMIFDAAHSYLPAWRLYLILSFVVMILLLAAVKKGKSLYANERFNGYNLNEKTNIA